MESYGRDLPEEFSATESVHQNVFSRWGEEQGFSNRIFQAAGPGDPTTTRNMMMTPPSLLLIKQRRVREKQKKKKKRGRASDSGKGSRPGGLTTKSTALVDRPW